MTRRGSRSTRAFMWQQAHDRHLRPPGSRLWRACVHARTGCASTRFLSSIRLSGSKKRAGPLCKDQRFIGVRLCHLPSHRPVRDRLDPGIRTMLMDLMDFPLDSRCSRSPVSARTSSVNWYRPAASPAACARLARRCGLNVSLRSSCPAETAKRGDRVGRHAAGYG
jgi:hypothetical protein